MYIQRADLDLALSGRKEITCPRANNDAIRWDNAWIFEVKTNGFLVATMLNVPMAAVTDQEQCSA
jgi:hypothetical protein